MLKRTILLTGVVLAAHLSAPASVRAGEPLTGIDGCAILASVIYTEVTAARLGFSHGSYGDWLYAGRDSISLCNRTARSVTGAFAAALQQTNIYVTWGFHTGYSGDYCLSHFLSQCYPTRDPAMPAPGRDDQAFVQRSWHAVFEAVSSQMSTYPGSDIARFNGHELGRSIRRGMLAGGVDTRLRLATR